MLRKKNCCFFYGDLFLYFLELLCVKKILRLVYVTCILKFMYFQKISKNEQSGLLGDANQNFTQVWPSSGLQNKILAYHH